MSRAVPDVPIAELNARTEHVKLLDVQVLSDNWYVLRKVTAQARRPLADDESRGLRPGQRRRAAVV